MIGQYFERLLGTHAARGVGGAPRTAWLAAAGVLALLLAPVTAFGQAGPEADGVGPSTPVSQLYGPVPLVRILDGDTIVVESNIGPRTVRLIGIDAPEVVSGEIGGRDAQAYLARLLGPGMLIWLELDLGLEDIYGRLLAYVYVPDANGAWEHAGMRVTQANLAMVEAGWARTLTISPNVTYADLYKAAAQEAAAEERGIWAPDYVTGVGAGNGSASDDPGTHELGEEPTQDPDQAPAAASVPPIRLHCGLLNPTAPNDMGEWVSVMLSEPYDTRGYYLFDEGSRSIFRLPAGVQPAGEIRVHNPGQGVWNNSGDVVYLMRGGEVVDSWAYEGHEARSGVVVCRGG